MPPQCTPASLDGTWQLTEFSFDGETAPPPSEPLIISIDDGVLRGALGCTGFEFDIDQGDDGSLALSNPATTELVCVGEPVLGGNYLTALFEVNRWETGADSLTLVSDNARVDYRARHAVDNTGPPSQD